jgi:Ni/Fe-hydrogenase subunit HybB-like protein
MTAFAFRDFKTIAQPAVTTADSHLSLPRNVVALPDTGRFFYPYIAGALRFD